MKNALTATHNEVLIWFLQNFKELVQDMKDSQHAFSDTSLNPYHLENEIYTHTLMVFKNSEVLSNENNYVKWSTLLHDIGKPSTREEVPERERVRFINHESVSAFMSLDILDKTDMTKEDKIHIFKIIARHGDLFHFITSDGKIKEDIFQSFEGEKRLLSDLVHQVRADASGRFFSPEFTEDNKMVMRLPEEFEYVINGLTDEVYRGEKPHNLTILVGPPCAGKSTWVEQNKGNAIVISRDALVEEVGRKRDMNYSEAFQFLLKNKEIERKEVSDPLHRAVQEARRNKQDVIIDMTNMSKKSRRKWINQFEKDYNKNCVVFIRGFEALVECSKIRGKATGKNITRGIIMNMVRNFTLPNYSEGYSKIEYVYLD